MNVTELLATCPKPARQGALSRAMVAALLGFWAVAMPLQAQGTGGGSAAAPAAVNLDGMVFAGQVRLGGAELRLNGTGVRQVAWFKGYAAGLYLSGRADTSAQVQALAGPKRLQLRLYHDVPAAEFSKAFRKGVMRNSNAAQQAALQERTEQFVRQIDALGKVRKGDAVDLDFEPARGLQLVVNGKPRGETLAGDDLYAALLRAFVGERPYDDKLRAGLLGREWLEGRDGRDASAGKPAAARP